MPTTSTLRIADEIADAVAVGDAARVAHLLGGIVANDDRVRDAIKKALANSPDAAVVVTAVTAVLSQ